MSAGFDGRKKVKVDVSSNEIWRQDHDTQTQKINSVAYSPKDDIIAVSSCTRDHNYEIRMYKRNTKEYLQIWNGDDEQFAQIMVMSINELHHRIVQMEFSCNGVLAIVTAAYNPLALTNPPAIFFLSPLLEYDAGEISSYAKLSPPVSDSNKIMITTRDFIAKTRPHQSESDKP